MSRSGGKLRLILDGASISSWSDVYNQVAGVPGVPDWFGRNPDAVAELKYFIQEPLEIVMRRPARLRETLGVRDFEMLISVLEIIRDDTDEDQKLHPVTLTIVT